MAPPTLTDKQRGVLRGLLAGLLLTAAALSLAILAPWRRMLPSQPFPATLAHALKWDVLLALCLVVHVALLGRHRILTPEDIDGSGLTTATPRARVLQATLQNTLEQAVLALVAHMAWSAVMPLHWQAAVPAAALLFVTGRALFLRGYARGAPSRALGFTLTFFPTVALLALTAGHLLLTLPA